MIYNIFRVKFDTQQFPYQDFFTFLLNLSGIIMVFKFFLIILFNSFLNIFGGGLDINSNKSSDL